MDEHGPELDEAQRIERSRAAIGRTMVEIEAYRAGDRAALESLFCRYYPLTRRIVARRLGCAVSALSPDHEDVLQDALLQAFQKVDRFEHRSEGSFRSWLAVIVERQITDRIRHAAAQRRDRRREEPAAATASGLAEAAPAGIPSPSEEAVGQELEERYSEALLRLPDYHAEIIMLRRDCGMSHAEIAAKLDLSVEAARMAYCRARSKLRELLGE